MWYVHINRNTIDSNRKHNRNDPPIRIQHGRYGAPIYSDNVVLPVRSRVRYSHNGAILPCGARLVIECEEEPIYS